MDDQRIHDALRSGPHDEPRYRALGADGLLASRSGRRPVAPLARAGARAFALAAVVSVLVVMLPLLIVAAPDRLDRVLRGGEIRIAVTAGPPQVLLGGGVAEGFDVDVAREVARALEVRAFVKAVDPAELAGGGWSDRWDLAFDSTVTTPARAAALRLGRPYVRHRGAVLVGAASASSRLRDLAGATVCVRAGGLADRWVAGTLVLSGGTVTPVPEGMQVVSESDLGRCEERVREGSADAMVADWDLDMEPTPAGLQPLDDAPFSGLVAAATAGTAEDDERLLEEVDRILERLGDRGTLRELSQRRFGGRDLTEGVP